MKKFFLFFLLLFLIVVLASCDVDEDGKISISLRSLKKPNESQTNSNENTVTSNSGSVAESKPVVESKKEEIKKTIRPFPELSHPPTNIIANRYRDNGDGTVTDLETKLEWMRCSLGQNLTSPTCEGIATSYKWNDAIEASVDFNFAGYNNWRVPSVDELKTLIHCSSNMPKTWNDTGDKCKGSYDYPTIVREAFPNTPNWFWSSSPDAFLNSNAWYVFFNYGYSGSYSKGNSNHVRLVRSQ